MEQVRTDGGVQFDESEPADRVDADGQLDDTDDEPGP
jgi:hypothetical protein